MNKFDIIAPKIVDKKVLGEFANTKVIQIKILAPIIAQHFQPGQFVILMVSQQGERIPLTITETDVSSGTITLIFQELGFTTKLLGKLNIGDELYHIVGPLGKPTEIKFYGSVVLVCGGVGTAELYPCAVALKEKNNRVITIIGARNKNLVILEDKFREVSDKVFVTTDDGSYGIKGLVTDVLENILKEEKINIVYAVGPVIMMKAVSQLTKNFNVPTIVSLNTIMVDGTGMCGSCRITYDGKIKYVCCDGPEFDGHKVDWDEVLKRNRTYIQQEQKILSLNS